MYQDAKILDGEIHYFESKTSFFHFFLKYFLDHLGWIRLREKNEF